ncbi:MAG: hypothetical protein ABFS42_07235 [Candidatus Krumholzibacteriota bacterium]
MILVILSLAVAVLIGWVLWTGSDYYATSLPDRPHHEDFRSMRPAGRVGHGLGILGSLMTVALLVYSLRKRIRFMQRWGDLRVWLRYHIFLGVVGPVLITLHTSFKIDGLVAVSYWSMFAVAVSGVFGRYLYQQIPRNVLGEELGADDIESRNEAILVELSENHGVGDREVEALENLALGPLENRPALLALIILPVVNIMLARQLHTWLMGFSRNPGIQTGNLARNWVLQARRLHLFHLIRDLFHWWHVFHKPFAFIMILIMIVHVAVALALGYTWEFGS